MGKNVNVSLSDLKRPIQGSILGFQNFSKSAKHNFGSANGDVKSFEEATTGSLNRTGTTLNSFLSALGVKTVTFGPAAPTGKQRGGGLGGTGTGDTIPAMLEPGEYVLNRKAVQTVGTSTLDHLNFNIAPRFQKGGNVLGPEPTITGTEPLHQAGQNSVHKVYKAATKYYNQHAEPGRVLKMLHYGERVTHQGLPYVYGGWHSSLGAGGAGPDCSGLVSAVLGAGNFISSPMAVAQGSGLYTLGKPGPGKFFTWGVRGTSGESAHTMISVRKPGNKGWAFFEAGGSGGGAHEDSGWDGSFQFRHMPGFQKGGKIPDKAAEQIAKYGQAAFDPKSRHFIGWGFQKGGSIGWLHEADKPWFKGTGQQNRTEPESVQNIRKGTGTFARKLWRIARRFFPHASGGLPTMIQPGPNNPALNALGLFPDVTHWGAAGPLVSIPTWMGQQLLGHPEAWAVKHGQASFSENLAKQTLIHEWAHTQQKGRAGKSAHWKLEGGAQAFARYAAPHIYAAAGIPYRNPSEQGSLYTQFANRAESKLGRNWVTSGQFTKGFQKGGQVSIIHPKWEGQLDKRAKGLWSRAHGLYPGSGQMPPLFIAKGLNSSMDLWGYGGPGGVELAPGAARSVASGGGGSYAQGLLLHEWAHVFQKGLRTKWEREGGATAFSRYAGPMIFGSGFNMAWPNHGYRAYTERVLKEKGLPWVKKGQFGFQKGGSVTGKVSWFNGGATAGGGNTSRPGIALNLNPGTESGWQNPTTEKWMEQSRAGHPVYAKVSVDGHSANLPIIDLGPAGFTGRAIDVTEGGVKKL
ncbi:MAG TPA: hypothetical protein VHI52_22320, partial [Verrucomicrobiae bacterium]|nr:hypothetical protein [Verrucomicrobiae bacterium]